MLVKEILDCYNLQKNVLYRTIPTSPKLMSDLELHNYFMQRNSAYADRWKNVLKKYGKYEVEKIIQPDNYDCPYIIIRLSNKDHSKLKMRVYEV